jgi:nicotinamidase-related amidase
MSRSVLLVIDVQDSFKADPTRWSRRNNPKFESNVSALISAYREAGEPIFFFCIRTLTRVGDPARTIA